MFSVHEDEIAGLEETAFADVMNHLLLADATRHDLPSHHVRVSLRTKEPDDGVDARIELPGVQASQYLPGGLVVLQYKAGNASPSDLRKEAVKPGVTAALEHQGHYLIAVGHRYGIKT